MLVSPVPENQVERRIEGGNNSCRQSQKLINDDKFERIDSRRLYQVEVLHIDCRFNRINNRRCINRRAFGIVVLVPMRGRFTGSDFPNGLLCIMMVPAALGRRYRWRIFRQRDRTVSIVTGNDIACA